MFYTLITWVFGQSQRARGSIYNKYNLFIIFPMFHFCTISYTDSRYMYMYIATFDKLLKSFNLH